MVKLKKVAVAGRPNVGKSSLVNQVLGKRLSIVEDMEKTTRDKLEYKCKWGSKEFILIDTGGYIDDEGRLNDLVSSQALRAFNEADILVFVTDVETGITAQDENIAKMLRRLNKPIIVAVNKVDNEKRGPGVFEFSSLGLGEPIGISSIHNYNIDCLLEKICSHIDFDSSDIDESKESLNIVIAGRPNSGKSSLFNLITKDYKAIVSDFPGTTRDTIGAELSIKTDFVALFDTAGVRKASKVNEPVEFYSVLRAKQTFKKADICIYLVDALEGITHQDKRMISLIKSFGTSLLLVFNKGDLTTKEQKLTRLEEAKSQLGALYRETPIIISAKTGANIKKIFEEIDILKKEHFSSFKTHELNKVIQRAQIKKPHPSVKIKYITQTDTRPPEFIVFSSKEIPTSYLRYLENTLRSDLNLRYAPIKINVKVSK